MSFLINRTVLEEKLVDNHDIVSGNTYYISSKIFDMKVISLQIVSTDVMPDSLIELSVQQSNDGVNFDDIPNSKIIIECSRSTTIERNNFSGKYLRVFIENTGVNDEGIVSVYLIAKR